MSLHLGGTSFFTSLAGDSIRICAKENFKDSVVINLILKRREIVVSFAQLDTTILNRSDIDILYLWIVYEGIIELVYFDLSSANLSSSNASVDIKGWTTMIANYSDLGKFARIQSENLSLGPGLFVSFQFTSRKGTNTVATFVPIDTLLVLHLSEMKRAKLGDKAVPDNVALSTLEWVQLILTGTSEARTHIDPASIKHHGCLSVYSDLNSLDGATLLSRLTKSSFSFVASVENSDKETNSLQFTTAEQFVLENAHQLGVSVFSSAETAISFQARSTKEYLSPSHGITKPTPLWECCAALNLVHPSRLDTVLKTDAASKPIIALMETLIASGRSDQIAQHIRLLAPHDTESVYLWLGDLWRQTKEQVKMISEKWAASHLARKKSRNVPATEGCELGVSVVMSVELKRLGALLNGITRVLDALRKRKVDSFAIASGGSLNEEQHQILLSISTMILECQSLQGTVALIIALCGDPLFSFRSFLPAPTCAPCASMRQVIQQRLESATDKGYLYYTPEILRLKSTLRDVHIDTLCAELTTTDIAAIKARVQGFFSYNSASLESFSSSLAQLLLLPCEVASATRQLRPDAPHGEEFVSTRAVVVARQLVLYACLEATLGALTIQGQNLNTALLGNQVLKIAEMAGYSLRLSVGEIFFVVSLWKIDANIDISSAVDEISRRVHSLESIDPRYLKVTIQRLLACFSVEACSGVRKLVGLYFHSDSPAGAMLLTSFGITATAASGLSNQLYMKGWLAAHSLCDESGMSPVEQVLARGQVALMLARWSALAGPDVLDAFLKSPMDENDVTVVKMYLQSLAEHEIRVSRFPGWTVRLTCAWLLQRRLAADARELFERYKSALVSAPGLDSWTADAGAVDMQRLLDAYDSVTKINTKRARSGDARSTVGASALDPTLVSRLAAHDPTFKSALPSLPATWFAELFN